MNPLSPRARGTLSVLGATVCWGVATVMVKHALGSIPPFFLLAFQLLLSVSFLWAAVTRLGHRSTFREIRSLSLPGLLNPGLAYALALLGLVTTTASMSTLLWAAEPILIFLLAWPLLGERWNPHLGGWLILGIAGVVVIAGIGAITSGAAIGNALILTGVACCALYSVISSRTARIADPLVIAAAQQSSAVMFALALAAGELVLSRAPLRIRPTDLFWAALAGFLYYTVAFWLYLIGLRNLPASRVGAMLNLVPVVGVSTAALTLGERLTPTQAIGAVLIIVSVTGAFSVRHSLSLISR